jgi:hypothetical protein
MAKPTLGPKGDPVRRGPAGPQARRACKAFRVRSLIHSWPRVVSLFIRMARSQDRRAAQSGRDAVLPDRGRQASRDLDSAAAIRLSMERPRCARALDEPASRKVGQVSKAASAGDLFTRPSNTANTGRRLPFPPRRTQRESLSSSLAAKAFSSFRPSNGRLSWRPLSFSRGGSLVNVSEPEPELTWSEALCRRNR